MGSEMPRKIPEVILFEEPGVKKKKKNLEIKKESETADRHPVPESLQSNIFDIKKARYEILKFGISGFEKNKKYQDKVSLAIKLGAKPPKKEYKNYKILIEERKQNKELQKREKGSQIYIQPLKRKKTTRRRKKKN